jgi:hypothetical protein
MARTSAIHGDSLRCIPIRGAMKDKAAERSGPHPGISLQKME